MQKVVDEVLGRPNDVGVEASMRGQARTLLEKHQEDSDVVRLIELLKTNQMEVMSDYIPHGMIELCTLIS